MRNLSLFSIVDLLDLRAFFIWLLTPIYSLYTWVTRFYDLYNFIAYKKTKVLRLLISLISKGGKMACVQPLSTIHL